MTVPSSFSRRLEGLLLTLILLLAAILRLGWPGVTEFKADEARLLALALDMATGQGFALRGISSSVGFPNFPMSVWLYALPLLFWRHVYAATLFTGLLNTVAVAGCYGFTRRYWGPIAALAATLMLAISPWAVIFSRKIWAQNLLPLFVLGWAVSAVLAFVEQRPKFLLLHCLCLAVAVQLHLSAVALVPITAILLLIFHRRVVWRWLLMSVGLAALTAVPFTIYLWHNQALLTGGSELAGSGGVISTEAWRFVGIMSLGTAVHSLAGPEAFTAYLARVPNITWVHWLWGGLGLAGILVTGYWLSVKGSQRKVNSYRREAGLILLLWLLGPPLFFTWHNTPLFLHYFITVLPAPYIFAGIAIAYLLSHISRFTFRIAGHKLQVASLAVVAVLLATTVAHLWLLAELLRFVGRVATPGGFGVPLAMQLETVERARQMALETGAAEVLVAGPGESVDVDESVAIYDVLLHGSPHRFVDIARSAVFPSHAAVVLLDGRAGGLADTYRETAVRSELIPLRTGEGTLQVLSLPGEAAPSPDATLEPAHLLANWVSWFGYDEPVRQGDETAVWHAYWRPGSNPDPTNYHFFVHLIDGQAQRVGQVDMAAFSPQQWQAGDIVVSRFTLGWPEAALPPFTLRVGMYTYPALEPVPLLDVAGNPYAEAAEIVLREP